MAKQEGKDTLGSCKRTLVLGVVVHIIFVGGWLSGWHLVAQKIDRVEALETCCSDRRGRASATI